MPCMQACLSIQINKHNLADQCNNVINASPKFIPMRTLERAKRGEFHQPDEDTVWLGFMVGGNEPRAPEIRCKSQILIEVTPAVSGST